MNPINPAELGRGVLSDPANVAKLKSIGVSPAYLPPDPKSLARTIRMEESKLQADCQRFLTLNGYALLTAENASTTPRGWYGHLVNCKRNPLMPDFFIFNQNMTRCLMVEFKTRNDYQPGQLEMITAGLWIEIRSLERFIEEFKRWEHTLR